MKKFNNKIIWIAHEGNRSGANNALLDYAEILNKKEYQVSIIIPSKGNMIEECNKRNLNTMHFYYASMVHSDEGISIVKWLKKRLRNIFLFFQILNCFIKEKPALIITNSIVTTPIFAIVAKILSKKHIWFIQEFGDKDHGLRFDFGYTITLKMISLFSDKIIVVADAIKNHFKKYINTSEIAIVFNRVNLSPEFTIGYPQIKQGSPLKILHIAQISKGKNQLEGIKSVKKLLNEGYDVELEIAGGILDNEYFHEIENYVSKNNFSSKIIFTGFTFNPYEKIKNADVVILCSRCEACALVIFETLKIGTPIIVSNTGGNTEIVNDMETGLVYQYGDSDDLAQKIALIYNDSLLRKTLAVNGLDYASKNYDTKISIQQIENIIKSL